MTHDEILADRRKRGLPHWKPSQRKRLRECIASGASIAYCNTTAHGLPANGGTGGPLRTGLVQAIAGPLQLCGPGALHATMEPHRWKGSRVWIVALHGEVKRESDKLGALCREVLGEVLREESWVSASVAIRVGENLTRANLTGANLTRANLTGANLRGENLTRANLTGANLRGANLTGANLYGADLTGANLYGANLRGADLYGADLRGANLTGANLYGADLYGANRGSSPHIPGWRTLATGYLERET